MGGERLLLTLYIAVARIWRFLLRMEAELSFYNHALYDEFLSEYIILKQRLCSLFILLLLARLWHIHAGDNN